MILLRKENEELKGDIKRHFKEIQKLQQINSYLIISQENRDNIISEISQENKSLKNKIQHFQNKEKGKKITNDLSKSSLQWVTPIKYTENKRDSLPYLNISQTSSIKSCFEIFLSG